MLESVLERYRSGITQETREKLLQSRKFADQKANEKRELHCPVCGLYLEDVYGREHIITARKCPKCKFDEPIDLALFRTRKGQKRHSFMLKRNKFTR